MENSLNHLLEKMWGDYIALNPQAKKIASLLNDKGEVVENDHIALRTFNHPKVNIAVISKAFVERGYKDCGEYFFDQKKLYAKHFEHSDSSFPKIFISELLLEEFSDKFQSIVQGLLEQVSEEEISRFDFTCSGRPWEISEQDYLSLLSESDYGAWMSAIGYRPNHFTVNVNKLKNFKELQELNDFLKSNGVQFNTSGGEIKGTPQQLLEQSSTLADSIDVEFTHSSRLVPSCYFEFAKRYPMNNGDLYQGFIASSADKIFESTNKV